MNKFEGARVPEIENKLSLKTVNSLEVAEMMNVSHNFLLKKIEGTEKRHGLIEDISQVQLNFTDYFQISSYKDVQGKQRKCYEITKLGCEYIAHKTTGSKGNQFTLKYIEKFHGMEESLKSGQANLSNEDILLRAFDIQTKKLEKKDEQIKQLQEELEKKSRPLYVPTDFKTWRTETAKLLNTTASKLAWQNDEPMSETIRNLRMDVYRILSDEMRVNLDRRYNSRKARAKKEGATQSEIDKISYLDVIGSDKTLINAYVRIVKDIALSN